MKLWQDFLRNMQMLHAVFCYCLKWDEEYAAHMWLRLPGERKNMRHVLLRPCSPCAATIFIRGHNVPMSLSARQPRNQRVAAVIKIATSLPPLQTSTP